MPVIGDPRNGAEDAPAQAQELEEQDSGAAGVPTEAHLQVPRGENGLKDTQRGMARGKGLSTVQQHKRVDLCIRTSKVGDEFSAKKRRRNKSIKIQHFPYLTVTHPPIQVANLSGLHVSKKWGLNPPKQVWTQKNINYCYLIKFIYC